MTVSYCQLWQSDLIHEVFVGEVEWAQERALGTSWGGEVSVISVLS